MTREDRGPEEPGPDRNGGDRRSDELPERRTEDADVPAEDPNGNETARTGEATGGTGGREANQRRDGPTPGPNEQYCYSCGTVIKREAEICPECGVRQRAPPGGGQPHPGGRAELTTQRQRELENKANNDLPSTLLLSLFSPLFAYVEVGKPGYAVLNLLTANYLMLGVLIVPLHTYSTITDAREELRSEGVEGY